jgi:hypothetical protein
MKKITIKQMIENSNIPAKLIRSVIKQSGGFESFIESAQDIANHGIDGGFHGWIYYTDTCAFFKRNKSAILELAEDQAQDFEQGMLEMIQNFGDFRNNPISLNEVARAIYQGKGEMCEQVQNVMAWYAAEEVVRLYNDLTEE